MKTKKRKGLYIEDRFIIRYNNQVIKVEIKEFEHGTVIMHNKDNDCDIRVTDDDFEAIEIIKIIRQKYRDGYFEDSMVIAQLLVDIKNEWLKKNNRADEYVSNPKLTVGIDFYNKIEEFLHVEKYNFTYSTVAKRLVVPQKHYYIEVFVDENITNDGISFNVKYN